MVLESTIICVDNSDFMRNGDFLPTRLQAQQDAVNLVCHSKTRSNPENNVGLITMASVEVLVTLTTDAGRVLSKLHQVQPKGSVSFLTAVKVAHLALKHRQGRNHKTRIIVFVGSPVEDDDKELVKLGKKLKKEKVNVDVINFGEEDANTDKLTTFINTVNGTGSGSHLVTVPAGPNSLLSDALLNSPIVVGEDGAGAPIGGPGFEFGIDPNEDPELALALRVSMEEQRARQEDEAKKASVATTEAGTKPANAGSNEETLLEQAIAMSMQQDDPVAESPMPDLSTMSEEEQIAFAMQMSLQAEGEDAMDVDDDSSEKEKQKEKEKEKENDSKDDDEDYSDVVNDREFLQSVLSNLPGVDPNSEAIQSAMSSLAPKKDEKKDSKDQEKK